MVVVDDPDRALWVFVSVLVVSCPCALSLATPVALTVATDALARIGVLVTRGHAIEALARADHFVFDKTGTLTYGEMRVEQVRLLGPSLRRASWQLAAALEQGSEHAIAAALRLRRRQRSLAGLRRTGGDHGAGRVGFARRCSTIGSVGRASLPNSPVRRCPRLCVTMNALGAR
jgi:Cu2+-exporting ATPase